MPSPPAWSRAEPLQAARCRLGLPRAEPTPLHQSASSCRRCDELAGRRRPRPHAAAFDRHAAPAAPAGCAVVRPPPAALPLQHPPPPLPPPPLPLPRWYHSRCCGWAALWLRLVAQLPRQTPPRLPLQNHPPPARLLLAEQGLLRPCHHRCHRRSSAPLPDPSPFRQAPPHLLPASPGAAAWPGAPPAGLPSSRAAHACRLQARAPCHAPCPHRCGHAPACPSPGACSSWQS